MISPKNISNSFIDWLMYVKICINVRGLIEQHDIYSYLLCIYCRVLYEFVHRHDYDMDIFLSLRSITYVICTMDTLSMETIQSWNMCRLRAGQSSG